MIRYDIVLGTIRLNIEDWVFVIHPSQPLVLSRNKKLGGRVFKQLQRIPFSLESFALSDLYHTDEEQKIQGWAKVEDVDKVLDLWDYGIDVEKLRGIQL